MGRIAEALKKAERERQTLHAAVPGSAASSRPPSVRLVNSMTVEAPLSCAAEAVCLTDGMSESLVPYYNPSALISEQYRSLRTRLISQNPHNEHRVLAITSSIPREGKSITTANLAITMAEIRHLNVLIVDADFRRSSMAGMLNRTRSPGLTDVLAGDATCAEVVQRTALPNLHFVAAGDLKGRSAAELLSAVSARSAFRWFESQFNYTIVDTPPATTVTDVGVIGQMCAGVILVLRMGRTPEPLAKRAVRLLQVNNIPVVGALLVGRAERGAEYGDPYGYYRYYQSSTRRAAG